MGRFPSVQRGSLTPYIFSAPRSAEAICRIQNLLKVQERARDRLPTGEFGEAWTSHATRVPTNTNTPPEHPPIQIRYVKLRPANARHLQQMQDICFLGRLPRT